MDDHSAALVSARDMTRDVLDAASPIERLLHWLEIIDENHHPDRAAALFESVAPWIDARHYWVMYRMAKVYDALARPDAAFMMAAEAVRQHPDWPASSAPSRWLFDWHAARGRVDDALEVFIRHSRRFPEHPAAPRQAVEALLVANDMSPDAVFGVAAPVGAVDRRDVEVVPRETRPPWSCAVYGTRTSHYSLEPLRGGLVREPVVVSEMPDGEILICNETVAVRVGGVVQRDLSVSDYPEMIAAKVDGDAAAELHEVDAAILILDRFPAPNLCHFLHDQITRLEVYRRAGVDIATSLVVGPEIRTAYQREIAGRAGIVHNLGVARVARVRAKRLWVSSNCRHLQHAGHLGARWAQDAARAVLGGRGTAGTRRLLISRADAAGRRIVNEAEIFEVLQARGFERIVPGDMAFSDQVEAFRTASHVVGPHGAALGHVAMLPPGAHMLEIFHPLYGTYGYAVHAQEGGFDYAVLVGTDGLSDDAARNDPDVADASGTRFGMADIRVPLPALMAWLADTGLADAAGST